jgi:hypothetical protein
MFMTSFVPFVIVFTNAVKDGNAEDAALLEAAVSILQGTKHSSKELSRLCCLCSSLASYAASHVGVAFLGQTDSSADQSLLNFADAAMVDADILRELFGSDNMAQWDDLPGSRTLETEFGPSLGSRQQY